MTFYAAINANAAHPQEAFDFIELLYSEELYRAGFRGERVPLWYYL